MRIPVLVAYGTRPEAIKMAPVVRALAASSTLRPVVAVSGQHREMLDQVNALFGICPDHDLNIIRPGQSLTSITGRGLAGYAAILDREPVSAVLVQGDTTTTLAAAMAGFYQQVPVVHLEAGLRTGNPASPYPEEINRRLVTQLAALHLAPTRSNRVNLRAEGVADTAIRVTGNTGIDAFLDVALRAVSVGVPQLDDAIAEGRRIVLVTAHRRESWGAPMAGIGAAVAHLARRFPDVTFALPVHRNPLVREQLLPLLVGLGNVAITEPLDYAPFSSLIAASTLVLTDSGGIQEEAPSLGRPVLVLRDTTERPEAVVAGSVDLVGTDPRSIVDAATLLLTNEREYRRMARAVNPYGDGQAAARSVAAIEALLGVGDPLPDFGPQPRAVPALAG